MQARNVLFICTGNSCRSIMAEAYMAKRVADESLPIKVLSAGTVGVDGERPADTTLQVLRQEGMDTDGLCSNALDRDLIEWADLVLVMEPMHLHQVLAIAPEARDRVHYLAEWAGELEEDIIPDPIGLGKEFYEQVFELIKRSVEGLLQWLKK